MKTIKEVRAALVASALVLIGLTRHGWAQTVGGGATPSTTASRARAPTPPVAAGLPTSDGYTRYAASAPRNVSAQVAGSSQSKPRARDADRAPHSGGCMTQPDALDGYGTS